MSGAKEIRLAKVQKSEAITADSFNKTLEHTARAIDDLDERLTATQESAKVRDLGEFSGTAPAVSDKDGLVTYILDGTRKFAVVYNGELNQL